MWLEWCNKERPMYLYHYAIKLLQAFSTVKQTKNTNRSFQCVCAKLILCEEAFLQWRRLYVYSGLSTLELDILKSFKNVKLYSLNYFFLTNSLYSHHIFSQKIEYSYLSWQFYYKIFFFLIGFILKPTFSAS